jgi:hypothetical protein
LFEIGYRGFRYLMIGREIAGILEGQVKIAGDKNLRVPDPYSGFRYPPNIEGSLPQPWNARWRTNSHGHIASEDYPAAKPTGEFRIAAVGDSFTAGITSSVRWPDALQRNLNASDRWREAVGGRFTRVINFGIDGQGFEQFAGVVLHHVPPFEPDLVLVNFMSDDPLRRYRRALGFPPRAQAISQAVRDDFLPAIDWLDFSCSLVLATIFDSRCINIPVDLAEFLLRRSQQLNKFDTREEAVRATSAAIAKMMPVPNLIFVFQPTIQELVKVERLGILDDLGTALPRWTYVDMRPRLIARQTSKLTLDRPEYRGLSVLELAALPDDRKPEIYRWFLMPFDEHYSDNGNEIYADELAAVLIERGRKGRH